MRRLSFMRDATSQLPHQPLPPTRTSHPLFLPHRILLCLGNIDPNRLQMMRIACLSWEEMPVTMRHLIPQPFVVDLARLYDAMNRLGHPGHFVHQAMLHRPRHLEQFREMRLRRHNAVSLVVLPEPKEHDGMLELRDEIIPMERVCLCNLLTQRTSHINPSVSEEDPAKWSTKRQQPKHKPGLRLIPIPYSPFPSSQELGSPVQPGSPGQEPPEQQAAMRLVREALRQAARSASGSDTFPGSLPPSPSASKPVPSSACTAERAGCSQAYPSNNRARAESCRPPTSGSPRCWPEDNRPN
jgi:hypothetical protein